MRDLSEIDMYLKWLLCLKPVLNWLNICFANLVWGVWWTWKFGELSSFLIGQSFASGTWLRQFNKLRQSCVWDLKRFAQHALGTVCRVWQTLRLTGWNLRALLWKRKKTGTATHGWQCECFQPLALEEIVSFVDLWEGQHYRGTQQIKTTKWVSMWHSLSIHCQGFQPWIDDRRVLTWSLIDFT